MIHFDNDRDFVNKCGNIFSGIIDKNKESLKTVNDYLKGDLYCRLIKEVKKKLKLVKKV